MTSLNLILGAVAILCASGFPALVFSNRSDSGQKLTTLLVAAGSLAGLTGTALAFRSGGPASLQIPWSLPWGQFSVTVDPLSLVFLIPVFLIPFTGSVYGLSYRKQSAHSVNGRRLGIFYGLLTGAMAMVVLAHDAVLLLIAWETMALSAFFAATVDDDNANVRQAGLVYLIATHIGTLCLFALFVLWNLVTGSFSLDFCSTVPASVGGPLFVLALVGFGFKAGIMPLHVWLPGAHANAPSHVSAVMSGVMLKMGIYGIVRVTSLLAFPQPWWGGTLLTAGIISGIAGIAFSIGQNDIKRSLAYSSIENIGIIFIALGLALLGRSFGRTELMYLGLAGALLHVLNHSLFKSLLFLNAGAVIHVAHTRDINLMGGLAKKMPVSMALFALGSVAICGLPPLNGFMSEWIIYIGLFGSVSGGAGRYLPFAALGAVALATIGSLAIAGFIRLIGGIYLGTARHPAEAATGDPPAAMRLPMIFLAALCLYIGLVPQTIMPLINAAVMLWTGTQGTILPFNPVALQQVSIAAVAVIAGILLIAALLRINRRKHTSTGTWDCGYALPTARMQYTGSSFGNSIVNLFSFLLLPLSQIPVLSALFPRKSSYKSVITDTVLDRMVLPVFRFAGRYLPFIRILQKGQTHAYVLYILAILVVLIIMGV